MKRLIHSCIVLVAGAALFGCSSHKLTSVEPRLVENKTWVLTTMNGQPASGPRVTMELRPATALDGRIGGQAPCNRYFGNYQVASHKIHFTSMGSNRMACPPPLMTSEAEYLAMFPKLDNITIKEHGLVLNSASGDQELTYVTESANVSGQITASEGTFAPGSEIIVVLQDSAMPDDPAGIIGIERIRVGRAVDVVDYVVHYAPELVNPGSNYELLAEVIQNGQVMFATAVKPSVQLKTAPANH
ncbi:META domain-containing protein [Endozoicomonas sp. GU-1]|uniref:META domain-containing protein n=2 Tax=Endozoicomonas TaxID=305899 RepID=UPI0022B49BB2|nr:META domain-containing protein [Endozoicomonas sp. GU-1]WBA88334.1 META domain-containing protein [Endozoicomonas sp. GU-1]